MTDAPRADPGLQPERTELAWRRSALALAIGSLLSIRLLPEGLGSPVWAVPGVVGVIAAGWLWITARRRCRRADAAMITPGAMLPDGRTLLALAAIALTAAVIGLCAVLVASLGG